MKNSLIDLNNHLFEMIERINDDSLTKEEVRIEAMRCHAVADVARQILNNGQLQLDVLKMQNDIEKRVNLNELPDLLKIEKK